MKTTIDIADELLTQAKKKAADEGRTLRSVVEEALRELLSKRRQTSQKRIKPVVVKGTTPLEDLADMHRLILDSYPSRFERPAKKGRRAS